MFPCCRELEKSYSDLGGAFVLEGTVNRERTAMAVKVLFAAMPAPAEVTAVERAIAAYLGLQTVKVEPSWPQAEPRPAEKAVPAGSGKVLLGRAIKGRPIPMKDASPEQKTVVVSGRVFAVETREVQRLGATVLQFDMTDGAGSIRVSKYIPKEEDQSFAKKIGQGMYLTVSGSMKFNPYSKEVELEPRHIQTADAPEPRRDNAPVKRVELHLHTQMSAMDGLTDPSAAVKRAAWWGMPAVAAAVAQAARESGVARI